MDKWQAQTKFLIQMEVSNIAVSIACLLFI